MGVDRRKFLKIVGAIGAGSMVALRTGVQAQVITLPPTTPPSPFGPTGFAGIAQNPEAYVFFNGVEAEFIEAAVARLIPKDNLGAGALEAGVSYFIDQQLTGAFGLAAKWYMQGPWAAGTPEQGYQSPMNPQQVYRLGISAANVYAQTQYKDIFSNLKPEQQDAVLKDLEASKVDLPEAPAAITKQFFEFLLQNTMEGFFADPAYGGNRDKAGWKLVGFPGLYPESYASFVDQYNKKAPVEFQSLADGQK